MIAISIPTSQDSRFTYVHHYSEVTIEVMKITMPVQ